MVSQLSPEQKNWDGILQHTFSGIPHWQCKHESLNIFYKFQLSTMLSFCGFFFCAGGRGGVGAKLAQGTHQSGPAVKSRRKPHFWPLNPGLTYVPLTAGCADGRHVTIMWQCLHAGTR